MEKISVFAPLVRDIRMPCLACAIHQAASEEDAVKQCREVLLFPSLRPLIGIIPEQALHVDVRDLNATTDLFLFLLYLWP